MKGVKHEPPVCPPEHAELEVKLKKLEADVQEKLQGWQRALADYQNLKREWVQKQDTIATDARVALFRELLPTIDVLRQALANAPKDAGPWLDGMRHLENQFAKLLAKWKVTKVETIGKEFSPHVHEAVETRGTGEQVVAELSPGYTLEDKLIYPARVAVGNDDPTPARLRGAEEPES